MLKGALRPCATDRVLMGEPQSAAVSLEPSEPTVKQQKTEHAQPAAPPQPLCAKSGQPEPPAALAVKPELYAGADASALAEIGKLDTRGGAKVLTPRERKNKRQLFYRLIEDNKVRRNQARENPCPPALAMKIKADSLGLAHWFGVFLENDEDWNKVDVQMVRRHIDRNERNVVTAWLTRARLLEIYKDEDVVDAMIDFAKLDKERWRPNRNAPTCEKAIEFLVIIEDSEKASHVKEEELAVTGSAQLDANAGHIAMEQMGELGAPTPQAAAPRAPHRVAPTQVRPEVPPLPTGPPAPGAASGDEPIALEPAMLGAPAEPGSVDAKMQQYHQKLLDKQKTSEVRKADAKAKAKAKASSKEAEKQQKKADDERIKALASSKAKKWALGLDKDIGVAQEKARLSKEETRIGEHQRQDFEDKFGKWAETLQKLKQDMTSPLDEESAKTLLDSAPKVVKDFHQYVKNYPDLTMSG